jgi:hypothetical protein
VLNGQDVVVLLKLAGHGEDWTVRSLEADLGMSRAGVHRSLQRLSAASLYDLQRRRANISQTEEFLVHAVKYLFPPELNGETRGVPTAWAAPPLAGELAPQNDLPPVWPDPHGSQRGIAVTPLHPAVPGLAQRDPDLAERLALIDAIRMGDPRIRSLAAELLSRRLARPTATA